jgi:DNA-binding NarL/FixJ family response regulator
VGPIPLKLGVDRSPPELYSCFVTSERDIAPGISVLAVNHNAILREGLRTFIGAQPNVRIAGSVADADAGVKLFAETRPDLSLIDLNLPFGRGIDAIHRIRAIDPDAWIIGLVTYEWDDRGRDALAAGAAAVLSKDLIGEKLVPMIRNGRQLSQPSEPVKRPRSRWRTFVRAFLLHTDTRA